MGGAGCVAGAPFYGMESQRLPAFGVAQDMNSPERLRRVPLYYFERRVGTGRAFGRGPSRGSALTGLTGATAETDTYFHGL